MLASGSRASHWHRLLGKTEVLSYTVTSAKVDELETRGNWTHRLGRAEIVRKCSAAVSPISISPSSHLSVYFAKIDPSA